MNIKALSARRILIIRLSAVGDVVRTLPSLAVLRRNFPSAAISWLVEDKASDILQGQSELDEVIVLPRNGWSRRPRGCQRWFLVGEVCGFILNLRRKRFDLVIDFHGILKSGLLSWWTGAQTRVGFGKGACKEWNHLFNNLRVPLLKGKMSRFERNLSLLQGVGLDTSNHDVNLHVSTADRRYAHGFLESHGLLMHRPLIALHPGTSGKTRYKRWFPEAYAKLGDGLVKELGASIIVTWGPDERESAEKVGSLMRSPCVLSWPTKSLKQLAAIYQQCDLYIGGDTGPMHIAALMGIPVVVIYGPTDPVENAAYVDTPSTQVRGRVPCSPCRDRNCERLDCLKAVRCEDVLDAAKRLLLKTKHAS